MTRPAQSRISAFRLSVWKYYRENGRDFPWRKTRNPYRVLVSEVMLQQTQAGRVVPKYREFLRAFPAVRVLAGSSLRDVLTVWKGLGYNRRALMLHRASHEIVSRHGGKVPRAAEELVSLPGVGRGTACAVMAFAYNEPVVFVETNIRSVFIHRFFPKKQSVSDRELLPLVEATLHRTNPREWYWALMDYGSYLKKLHPNLSRRSAHYKKQSPFEGSDRQVRGTILRSLAERPRTQTALVRSVSADAGRMSGILARLEREGLVKKERRVYTIV